MSRLGKRPIALPSGVKVNIDAKNNLAQISGPKGQLSWRYPIFFSLNEEATPQGGGRILKVGVKEIQQNEGLQVKVTWGLTRSRIANMVTGVAEGFFKKLEIQGVGFKAQVQGKNLQLNLGRSHPINHAIPEGVQISIDPKQTLLTVQGADKELVGQVASQIRSYYEPEPYKGKGIRYAGEVIVKKAGKTAVAGAGASSTGGAKK